MRHEPVFPQMDSRKSPNENYDLNTFSVVREGASWRVNRGKYRESIARDQFLTMIGRQDLLPTVSPTRRTGGLATLWTGVVATGLGGGILLYEIQHADRPDFTGTRMEKVGWGLIGVGTVAIIVGSLIAKRRGPPISPEEADQMADDYNTQLKSVMQRQTNRTPVQAWDQGQHWLAVARLDWSQPAWQR